MVRTARLSVFVVLALAGAARGQESKPAEGGGGDVLGGPKVVETTSERSLIKRDFSGRVRRTEVPPDEAAIELLNLDWTTKEKVRKIVDERAAILDKAVMTNIDLLLKLQNTTERVARQKLIEEFVVQLKDLSARGKLRDEVKKELTAEQAKRYDELIDGYWTLLADDVVLEAKNKGETLSPLAARAREATALIGQEIRRSYERQIAGKLKEFEELLGKLGLSEEKETKLRRMVAEFGEKYKGNADKNQRRELFLRMYRELNKEQQKVLLTEVLGKPSAKDGEPAMMPAEEMAPPAKEDKAEPKTDKK